MECDADKVGMILADTFAEPLFLLSLVVGALEKRDISKDSPLAKRILRWRVEREQKLKGGQ